MTIVTAVPNVFTNGTVADATLVNADYAALVAQINAGAAENGANVSITSLLGLTTPLSAAQGGTQFFSAGTTTGLVNVLAATTLTPTLGFALTAGVTVAATINITNTLAATLNVNGTGAVAINKNTAAGLAVLTGGELIAGQRLFFTYTGSVWVPVGSLAGAALLAAPNIFTADQTFQSPTGSILAVNSGKSVGAPSDIPALIRVSQNNASSATKTWGQLYNYINIAVAGAEASMWVFETITAGVIQGVMRLGAGIWTPGATGGDKGADSINVKNYYKDGVAFAPPTASAGIGQYVSLSGSGVNVVLPAGGTWAYFTIGSGSTGNTNNTFMAAGMQSNIHCSLERDEMAHGYLAEFEHERA